MFDFKVEFHDSGIKELQRRLKRFDDTQHVPFDKLFPPRFMRKYPCFQTIEQKVKASGYEVESARDFGVVPDAAWTPSCAPEPASAIGKKCSPRPLRNGRLGCLDPTLRGEPRGVEFVSRQKGGLGSMIPRRLGVGDSSQCLYMKETGS